MYGYYMYPVKSSQIIKQVIKKGEYPLILTGRPIHSVLSYYSDYSFT